MKVKVCGISSQENIDFISRSSVDMIGLNFYPPSIRYISEQVPPRTFNVLPSSIKRVGVFVNESEANILRLSNRYKLDYVQLHGDESLEFCKRIATYLPIIKVFRVDDDFDFSKTMDYTFADYLLFDTRTPKYGGSGQKFAWKRLNDYTGSVPFLLSGGIGPSDFTELKQLTHPHFAGIDINSQFENEPGIKDEDLVSAFLLHLNG